MNAPFALHCENQVVTPGGTWTLGDLAGRLRPALGSADDPPVAIVGNVQVDLIAGAAALAQVGREGILLPRTRLSGSVSDRLEEMGFALVDADTGRLQHAGSGPPGRTGVVHLLTSGSTGEAKLLQHTWASLYTMARVPGHNVRWLMTYQPGTYAWFQIVTRVLFADGQILVASDDEQPDLMLALAADHGVTAISATPTFWRLALLQTSYADLDRLSGSLRQVTLGGESVDQAILNILQRRFPEARIAHIYASTEAGATILVSDGRAGFPVAWLDDPARAAGLRLEGGHLWIRSPHAAIGLAEWIDTQDLAERRGDRVHVLGRAGHGMINVGGAKALAADIERVVMEHPYVLWCRARAVRAPLVGNLVAADVVPRPEAASEPLPEIELTALCAGRLPAHMVPRIWQKLETIPATPNWKTEV